MAGWFKAFLQKHKNNSSSSSSQLDHASKYSPSLPSPPPVKSSSTPANSSTASPKQVPSAFQVSVSSSDSARWSKLYDVCICHNEDDLGFVEELASYLESQPEHFRCFLQLRDAAPGGAIVTELSDAVQNSHCWVLLITPNFLKDPWCRYQMHHALTEAPMANGRAIPVLKDMDRRDYPQELRCLYYISVALQETSFRKIKETVVRYLQELCQNTRSRN
ncbi:toll/interleukin-1 receptor domain-containing adapter protein [Rhineura floridana]|uniref:toll/interleukin-1 receptor domain-containing adapter protein n=1 Tax=Rhineura floridana TaxID=261503 RepID=UPI002AC86C30|nr:toll/interleukin-1 receptor domain-containing adapter protein [Rhineura floridana]XP_061449190.1 toll/interleukin-1 receptor domain-containing adapter protein [Rhineura floridana]XP_061449191.1 toll/interleukin-1 receptor domain-containing adapter protein [Rhineura floridana]